MQPSYAAIQSEDIAASAGAGASIYRISYGVEQSEPAGLHFVYRIEMLGNGSAVGNVGLRLPDMGDAERIVAAFADFVVRPHPL